MPEENGVVSRTPLAAVGIAPHGVDPDGPDERQFRVVTVRTDYADAEFATSMPSVIIMPPTGWVDRDDDGEFSITIPADLAAAVAGAIRDAASTARRATGHW